MPSDVVFKTMNSVHKALLAVSFGHVGWSTSGMPVLQLTTKGRKSGELRTVMVTSPWQEGDTLAIVASRGGDDHHPAWFLNLRDDPDVEVTMRGTKRPMRARIADAEERARIWPLLTADHRNYAGYQKRTDREIPVVLLEPRPA